MELLGGPGNGKETRGEGSLALRPQANRDRFRGMSYHVEVSFGINRSVWIVLYINHSFWALAERDRYIVMERQVYDDEVCTC